MRYNYMKRLKLYTLNTNYSAQLEKTDSKVMAVSPNGKQNRPFVGIVLVLKDKQYCIPFSSAKKKHINIDDSIDFLKVYDSKGKHIAVLNFNNMIPVDTRLIIPINLSPLDTDSPKDLKYKDLLNNELTWCNNNRKTIFQNARNVYTIMTEKPEDNPKLVSRCCDFKKLEVALEQYLIDNGYEKPKKQDNETEAQEESKQAIDETVAETTTNEVPVEENETVRSRDTINSNIVFTDPKIIPLDNNLITCDIVTEILDKNGIPNSTRELTDGRIGAKINASDKEKAEKLLSSFIKKEKVERNNAVLK